MKDASGTVIDGRYTLIARLGGGGAGTVYRATNAEGRSVAVKLLDVVVGTRAEMRERFEREARALNGLDHPHLIRILDYGVFEGTPYTVMELLTGLPLDQMMKKKPLPLPVAFEIGMGVIAGLSHAHTHGVLHRDLKPANVFVAVLEGAKLHPKLLDFGLARFTDSDRWGAHATLTTEGTVLGTPAYMPPEQGIGSRVDARSDVYAAGVLLYELLAGRPPFVHESRASMIRAHVVTPAPPLAEAREGLQVQPSLEAIVMRALSKKADDRFPDARALLEALQRVPEPAAWI